MTKTNISVKSIALTYGSIYALISILTIVLVYVLNMGAGNNPLNYIIAILKFVGFVAVFWFGIYSYKKQNEGYLNLSEALKSGMAIALVLSIFTAIYMYIHYTIINPEFLDQLEEQQRIGMMSMGNFSESQMEEAMKSSAFTRTAFFLTTGTLITNLFGGFIVSLLVGLIQKNKKPELG